jgi:hypothetical protein
VKPVVLIAALAVTLSSLPAYADKGGKDGKHKRHTYSQGCPPGLAKKGNGCQPPGLAKKARHGHGVGDYLRSGEYRILDHPARYGLPRDGVYAVVDGYAYRINSETSRILAVYGLLSALAN